MLQPGVVAWFPQSPIGTYTHFIQGHGPSYITVPHTFSKAFSKTCIIQSDPHHYTSGRWLRDDATQRQKRYIDFDLQLLCNQEVSLSPGATAVRSWQKKEGEFNRIFIMNLDSGSKLVAEIPYPGVGLPQRRATASEVATIAYCRYISSMDPGHLYDGALTPARGGLLSDKRPQMTGPQRVGCISPIFQNMKQLQDLEFPAYGSLCFYEEISLVSTKKCDLDRGICLSQHCGIGYWDSDSTSCAPIHRGPW